MELCPNSNSTARLLEGQRGSVAFCFQTCVNRSGKSTVFLGYYLLLLHVPWKTKRLGLGIIGKELCSRFAVECL